ncbi:MAG: sugar ABC transporter ATP-binding protein [Capsulimonadales bacterium]|nr:sugar ABC transporter ATP-binding protein [Capsulimonadales bacterium]
MSKPDGSVLLRTIGLSKAFGSVTVLENADVELRAGEIHAFLGENGAGKSTLAKLIGGIHRPTAGRIERDGRPVTIRNPREAASLGIGLIPQEPRTFPDLSAAENIFVGRLPMRGGRVDWKTLYGRAEELLRTLGVEIDPRRPARGLSVADRQMLELAGALSLDARILLLDETTASLTPGEVGRLGEILRRLRSEGKALVFIGHRMEEIFDLCDRATVLRDGRIVGERRVRETTPDELLRLMVGRAMGEAVTRKKVADGPPILEVVGWSQPPRFRDISFSIRKGEIVGLAGLVGAGRTEIACALFGLSRPTSGEVRIDGRPVEIRSPEDAMRHGMALVPEDRQRQGAFLPLSLRENVTLSSLPRLSGRGWLREDDARSRTTEWVRRLGVRCREIEQPLRQLSGGNQQKIVLAKWLETGPRILLLDEPTRGIDVNAKTEVHRWIAELADQGVATLLISSDLPEVLALSDRVLVLRAGRLVREFAAGEATPEAVIAAAGVTTEATVR